MPEPPASSHLLEGKRGAGGGGREGSRGGPGIAATGPTTTSAVVPSINNITPNSVAPESTARERDRGGSGDRRRDDLTTPSLYSASDVGTVPTTAPCDVGRGSGGGIRFIPGGTPSSSSGGFSQEQKQQHQGSGALDPFQTSGMDVTRMQQQLSEYTDSLFLEGLLDDQFTQLQLLQDENNPDFVAEVVSLFFDDSEKLLEQLTESLETDPIDYKKVDAHVHQFKGSSSSIGAQRVKTACVTFRTCCEEENKEGCRQALTQVKQEFYLVKSKLEAMLALEQRLLAAGGTLPFMEC
ncbi:unnamed protein product [Calypogeia fissa]